MCSFSVCFRLYCKGAVEPILFSKKYIRLLVNLETCLDKKKHIKLHRTISQNKWCPNDNIQNLETCLNQKEHMKLHKTH